MRLTREALRKRLKDLGITQSELCKSVRDRTKQRIYAEDIGSAFAKSPYLSAPMSAALLGEMELLRYERDNQKAG